MEELTKGTKYRVRYLIPGLHRRERELVATYIGRGGYNDRDLVFSGRPIFGTTEVDERHVNSVHSVDQDTECYAGKMVDDGVRLY